MRTPKDLIALHIASEDLGDYNVSEAGWYAVDDGDRVIPGPLDSLAPCEGSKSVRSYRLMLNQIMTHSESPVSAPDP